MPMSAISKCTEKANSMIPASITRTNIRSRRAPGKATRMTAKTGSRRSCRRCNFISCRYLVPKHRPIHSTPRQRRAARSCSQGRQDAPAATCRRCLPNRAGICTRRTRSGSTIFKRSVRLTIVPHNALAGVVGDEADPQGWLLSRWPLRNSEGCGRTLQQPLHP